MSSNLCHLCRAINFSALAWDRSNSPESTYYELGTFQDVIERSPHCIFCQNISQANNKRAVDEKVARLDDTVAITGRFIASTHKSEIWNPEDPNDNSRLRVSQITVQVKPAAFNGVFGPALPPNFYISRASIKEQPEHEQPWHLVSFLASSPPLPSVDSFCSTMWQSLPQLMESKFSGRVVHDEFDLRLADRWLNLCRKHHGHKCMSSAWMQETPGVPGLRVIDVENLCVVPAPDGCQYVCLSYTWGSVSTVTATTANKDDLAKPGALSRRILPPTIMDAIQVTAAAKKRFLWVDALCIVQDDQQMLQAQIPQMGTIYDRAVLTIIAASGDNSDAGLAGVRPGSRHLQQNCISLPSLSLLTAVDDGLYEGIMSSRWSTRAWTMQEALFSRRQLAFTPKQVYWVCREAKWLEETALETRDIPPVLNGPSGVSIVGHQELLPYQRTNYYPSHSSLNCLVYEELVRSFSMRHLSFVSDSLNAFAGVINTLAKGGAREFAWGLPEKYFSRALQWRTDYDAEQHHGSMATVTPDGAAHEVAFPSWSWSAWSRPQKSNSVSWETYSEDSPIWRNYAVIKFYRSSVDGKLRLISEEANRQLKEAADSWTGHPRMIEEAEGPEATTPFVDIGVLHFWTSVAEVYVTRHRTVMTGRPLSYVLHSKSGRRLYIKPEIQSTAAFGWNEFPAPWPLEPKYGPDLEEECDLIPLYAVVVAPRDDEYLNVLLVTFKDGIACRLGASAVPLEEWFKLETTWKLVKLG
jgi:hypothetical protein